MNNLIEKIKKSIELADQGHSKLTNDVLSIEGMSSSRFRHLLNNLIDNNTRFLEIGTWKGSTLISALYKNTPEFYIAIDDSSHHGDVSGAFYENYKLYISQQPPNYIQQDSFTVSLSENKINNINLYFYDGGHDWEQHYNALTYFYDGLADTFIFIVDDYDCKKIQNATLESFKKNNITVEYSVHLTSEHEHVWWHGTLIAICKKNN